MRYFENLMNTDMKEKILFCLMLIVPFVAGAQSVDNLQGPDSAALIVQPSDETQYLLVYYSDRYVDSLVRDIGADEVELDNLYTALDDYAFYLYKCTSKLESSGLPYFSVDSDRRVYIAAADKWLSNRNRGFVVIAVSPDGRIEYEAPLDFLNKSDNLEEE